MDTIFPLGFPLPTALYLVLYVVTLVAHVILMNYVVAGSGYLACVSIFTGGALQRQRSPMAMVLRDWLPFVLGGAITAGVAPLLFIQILYRDNFYTANLLGFHRWMLVVPVLIVGFYLLYLLKSRRIGTWAVSLRTLVGVVAFACFAFVAYSWTENYLLSVQDQQTWSRTYLAGSFFYANPQLVPRLAVWFIGALPTMAMFVGWQLWYAQPDRPEVVRDVKRVSRVGFIGLLATAACAAWYYTVADEATRSALVGPMARAYFAMAAIGFGIQLVAWYRQHGCIRFQTKWLTLATVGSLMTILGMTVTREAMRIAAVDITRFQNLHADAVGKGGLITFLVFFAVNAVLIAWCVHLVRNNQIATPE